MNFVKNITLLFLVGNALVASPCKNFKWERETHWDWSSINAQDNAVFWQNLATYFPKIFAWGVATSAFQIEGTQTANSQHCQNSWTIHKKLPQPGIATGHWDRYKEDVQLIKNLGMTHYRLSIEWSKIEPYMGIFDQDAMQHYIDLIEELIKNGITPVLCLFHHTWPVWFDKIKHFEKQENIKYFVQFAEYVFQKLHHRVNMWMTFNEPAGYAMAAYIDNKYPPKKKLCFRECGIWLKHVLYAHVEVAQLFKKIDPTVKVGFPKMFNPLDPWNSSNPIDYTITKNMNYFLHDSVLNFFKDGHFKWGFGIKGYHKDAPKSLDWLGVNYYSHTMISWFKRKNRKDEPCTGGKNSRTIYPEGLYRAIKKAHELTEYLNIPLYITENGVNDPEDMWKNEYLKKHIFVVKKAIEEGIDIRGYFWWTLTDSFSWSSNTDSKMGFYKIDENLNRSLRNGVQPFLHFIQTVKNN